MYKYVSAECLFRSEEGRAYTIDMETPFVYETESEAEKDSTVYRFRKEDKQVKLIAYPSEWLKTEVREDGTRYARPVVVGDPISKYTYRQFKDLGGRLRKIAAIEEGIYSTDEFIDAEESFVDLFPGIKPGEEIYIERGRKGLIYEKDLF